MKKRLFISLLVGAMVFSIVGCGNTAETQETETVVEETETEEETYKEIGTETESAFCVKLKNSTGQDITGISVKLTDDTEFPENMLSEEDIFVVDEERNLFYEGVVNEIEEETPAEDEKILAQGYDIQLTFADESVKVLHAFPFEDIAEGEILLEDEVAFIKYVSVSSNEEVSTKEAELATKEAEEAAQTEAYVEEYYVEDNYWYEEDVYVDDGASDNAGAAEVVEPVAPEVVEPTPEVIVPEAPAQGTEDCLGDGALTY